ncbi:MAG: RluA family pseudouridine synthase [Oscillospiraceae bacterium]|nr:RluA family pseudouridine synthase [Oscillospiraceae bacterium]
MKSFTATTNDNGVRLSRFCEKVCPKLPKSMLYKSFRNKRIKVNGKKQDADYRINTGDLIELYINDEFFADTPAEAIKPSIKSSASLNIVYEDENILLINKPQGLLCHSDNKSEDNIVDMVIAYLAEKGEYLPEKENSFTPALCNRIDQGTEGIVIAAKKYRALADMNEIIRNDRLVKQYLAVTGKPAEGRFSAYLTRNKQTKKVAVTPKPVSNESKDITTVFKTLKSKSSFHLVECTLVTGRTHQIRAHLAYLGAGILGDRKYGIAHKNLKSQLLCAYKLSFENIENNNSLAYLNGKCFELKDSFVQKYFEQL